MQDKETSPRGHFDVAKQEEGEEGKQMRGHKIVKLWPTTMQLDPDYVLTN